MAEVNPTVSVCIPTYNRAEMLRESIASVLGQSFRDFELIISDNASEDGTEAMVNSFRDERISYVRNKTNIGLIRNFNQCLDVAKGVYVTIFHDDDIMLHDNLSYKVRALENNPTVGFVHSKFHVIDEHGEIIEYDKNLGQPQTDDYVEQGLRFVERTVTGRNIVNPPSVMMRKECYATLGGFSEKLLFTTDFEYWMRIALHYDVMFIAVPLIKYRIHPGWGTAEYMVTVGGSRVRTVKGLEEHLAARQMILRQAKDVMGDVKEIKRAVRKLIGSRLVNLVEKQFLAKGDRRGAQRAIVQIFRRYPEVMKERSVRKLVVKAILSEGTVHALKRLPIYRQQV